MKNLLLTFMWIFSIILPFLLPSMIFAQGEVDVDGIDLTDRCFKWMWKDCFRYETIIGIDTEQQQKYTAESIAQDVILSATYMVWTVLAIVIIFCWFWYIIASKWGKNPDNYRKWLISAGIWAVLVRWAYAIIRLIQYIAKW